MRVFLAGAWLLAGSFGALAYDDPAIAVCEYEWARGADVAEAGYVRVDAILSGDTVTLTYERSVLNTKPQPSQQTCQFEAEMNGDLVLKRESAPEIAACHQTLAEAAAFPASSRGSPEAITLAKKLDNCESVFQAALDAETEFLTKVTLPLILMDIYPIKPTNTELNVAIDAGKFQGECSAKQADLEGRNFGSHNEDSLKVAVQACRDAGYLQ